MNAHPHVGVELFAQIEDVEPDGDEEEYEPARGRWVPQLGRRAARVTRLGQDALHASAKLLGEQVGEVVRETLAGMDAADLAQATAAGLRPASIQLSFGVKLTVGTGDVVGAVITAGGEASVQVVVTLDRTD